MCENVCVEVEMQVDCSAHICFLTPTPSSLHFLFDLGWAHELHYLLLKK